MAAATEPTAGASRRPEPGACLVSYSRMIEKQVDTGHQMHTIHSIKRVLEAQGHALCADGTTCESVALLQMAFRWLDL